MSSSYFSSARGLVVLVLLGLGSSACSEANGRPPEVPPPVLPPWPDAGPDGRWTERESVNLFVSGHSLTDNPMPDFVGDIASSQGRGFVYNQQIGLGSPLRVRTKGEDPNVTGWPGYGIGKNRDGMNMDVLAELANPTTIGVGQRYDTFVVTDRHDLLEVVRWEDTIRYLRHYHDRFIGGNAAGRTFLSHSWLFIDKDAPEEWIAYETNALAGWECVAAVVNHTIEADGRNDWVMVLPAGYALVQLTQRLADGPFAGIGGTRHQRLDAIFYDSVHMTRLGAYYIAAVTYASIYGRSPVGAPAPADLDATHVAGLQQLAWDVVSDYYAHANPSARSMEWCRSFTAETLCPGMYRLVDRPNVASMCANHFASADQSEFRWPNPSWTPFPAP